MVPASRSRSTASSEQRVRLTARLHSRAEELLHSHVALLGNLLVRAHLPEALDDRARVVERRGGAELLGEDVLVPGELEDGAAGAARDDARAGAGGAEHHHRATLPLDGDAVREGLALGEGHVDHALARIRRGFRHRNLHLLRLGAPDADLALAVAHPDRRAEAHVRAALRDLRHALHLHHRLLEAVAVVAPAAATASAPAPAAASTRSGS